MPDSEMGRSPERAANGRMAWRRRVKVHHSPHFFLKQGRALREDPRNTDGQSRKAYRLLTTSCNLGLKSHLSSALEGAGKKAADLLASRTLRAEPGFLLERAAVCSLLGAFHLSQL